MVLELTKAGELKAIRGELASALRADLNLPDDYPVFVPYATYSKGGRQVSIRLIDGYAFVASGLTETRFLALERGTLVERVMSSNGPHGMRVLQTVPDAKIRELRDQLRAQVSLDLEIGLPVRVTGGNYATLEGVVVELLEDRAGVRFTMRSLDVVAFLPRVLVEVITEGSEDHIDPLEIDPLDMSMGDEHLPEE